MLPRDCTWSPTDSGVVPGRRLALAFGALALLFGAPQAPLAAQAVPLDRLDDYVTAAMDEWQVPGLALAVVHGDRVVYAKGFGVRDVTGADPVDEHTLFAVGSTSKAFTATALGMLVDEGKVGWDDPVVDHLPDFRMYDPWVTRELTIRDLLTHRSGLARGDAVWILWPHDRAEVMRRIRYLEPTRSLRSAWQYQNLMFLTAGEVVQRASGRTWDDFVAERIFSPLGMSRSVTSVSALDGLDNVASPHVSVDGRSVVVEHKNIDNVGPAGSIYSSVAQMTEWIRLHLRNGRYGDVPLVSDSVMEEMHAPQMVIQPDAPENSLHAKNAYGTFNTYGLAWWVMDYRGRTIVDHGGGIDGMRAHVALMPEMDVGMVALSNARPNNLIAALMYRVFDHYLGGEMVDWSAEMLAEQEAAAQDQAEARAELEASRMMNTTPALPLDAYVGRYESRYYGAVDVAMDGEGLTWTFGGKTGGRLGHWHHEVFRMIPDSPARAEMFGTFRVAPDATVAGLEIGGLGSFPRS
ncbi:MAG: serine hydrolase [Gemmatimonadetes bacterium]|nr:serine hydrolase [Gemmatimonadota bacterium]